MDKSGGGHHRTYIRRVRLLEQESVPISNSSPTFVEKRALPVSAASVMSMDKPTTGASSKKERIQLSPVFDPATSVLLPTVGRGPPSAVPMQRKELPPSCGTDCTSKNVVLIVEVGEAPPVVHVVSLGKPSKPSMITVPEAGETEPSVNPMKKTSDPCCWSLWSIVFIYRENLRPSRTQVQERRTPIHYGT